MMFLYASQLLLTLPCFFFEWTIKRRIESNCKNNNVSWGKEGHNLPSWKWVKEADYYDRSVIFPSSYCSVFWSLSIFWRWSAHNLRWEVFILFHIDPNIPLIYALFAWPVQFSQESDDLLVSLFFPNFTINCFDCLLK